MNLLKLLIDKYENDFSIVLSDIISFFGNVFFKKNKLLI